MTTELEIPVQNMTFDQWWAESGEWVEPPNERRGGQSGVLRVKKGGKVYYIKRQIGHIHRTLLHPLGIPTALRERRALHAMAELGICAPKVIFCDAKRSPQGQWQALIVTEELTGFIDSDSWFKQGLDQSINETTRLQLMQKIGQTLAKMNQARWQHGCIYGKHVFINTQDNRADVALLDFEKARQRFTASQASQHDIPQLRRHSLFTESDWQQLLEGYKAHSRN